MRAQRAGTAVTGAALSVTHLWGHATLADCVTTNAGQTVCNVSAGLGGAVAFFLIFYLVMLAVMILAWVSIVKKAGYSGWWVLIVLVPIANIVFFLIFAFSEWPVLKELRALRSQASANLLGYRSPTGYSSGYGGWTQQPQPETPLPSFNQPQGSAPGAMSGAPFSPAGQPAQGGEPSAGGASPAAGWYPTPDGRRRYWDGTSWTDHYA